MRMKSVHAAVLLACITSTDQLGEGEYEGIYCVRQTSLFMVAHLFFGNLLFYVL